MIDTEPLFEELAAAHYALQRASNRWNKAKSSLVETTGFAKRQAVWYKNELRVIDDIRPNFETGEIVIEIVGITFGDQFQESVTDLSTLTKHEQ